jgi:GntR family transcriptional regulator, rspAB operon transcriptional repressor
MLLRLAESRSGDLPNTHSGRALCHVPCLTPRNQETHSPVHVPPEQILRAQAKPPLDVAMKSTSTRSRVAAKSSAAAKVSSAASATPASREQTASLAQRAYLEIRNKILKGDLPVGAAISRRKLAEELNISVPPVMEALQRLEREGLVESKPRVGTRVRIPTRRDVEDRSLVREALETQAARLFAERATTEEREELKQMGRRVDQLYAACESNSGDRDFLFSVNSYHMKMHLRIADCARCAALRDAIEKEQVLIFNWLFDTAVQRRTLGSDFHARLADALANSSPDQADAAMRQHIRFGLNEVLSKLENPGQIVSRWRNDKSVSKRRRNRSSSQAR